MNYYSGVTFRDGKTQQQFDGLANALTGMGTSVDRRTHARWLEPFVDQQQIEQAYRSSWLARRIVNTPADDQTRAWRDWQATDDQIEKLEAVEKKHRIRDKFKHGIRLGRLGGGAIIIGLKDGTPDAEIPETVNTDDLLYVQVVSRFTLNIGPIVDDPADEDFGEPAYFELRRKGGAEPVRIHRDRVIVFKGEFSGQSNFSASNNKTDFWGDSIILSCDEPIKNAETAMNEFAALISEAKIDVFGIPDLMTLVGSPEGEKRIQARMNIAAQSKSIHRAYVKDAAETWEQHTLQLGQAAEVIRTYLAVVAGAADIPATRLLGKSPDGMNATGASDQNNYDQKIKADQDEKLRPGLEKLDKVLIPSALGSTPKDVYWTFAPLSVPSDKELADQEKVEADTLAVLVTTGLFMDEALEEAYSNRMIESERWPGYEKARKDALAKAEEEPAPEDIAGVTLPAPSGGPVTPPVVVPPRGPQPPQNAR